MLHARVSRANPASSFSFNCDLLLNWGHVCVPQMDWEAAARLNNKRLHLGLCCSVELGNSAQFWLHQISHFMHIPHILFNEFKIYGVFHELARLTGTGRLDPAAVWNKKLFLIYRSTAIPDKPWKTFHQYNSSQHLLWTSSPNFIAILPKRVKILKLNRNWLRSAGANVIGSPNSVCIWGP